MGVREDIYNMLSQAEDGLDWMVNLGQYGWEKGAIRWALTPAYAEIDFLRRLTDNGGLPDNLWAASAVFANIAAQLDSFATATAIPANLRALNQSESWDDPKASETYIDEFTKVQLHLQDAQSWTAALSKGLYDEYLTSYNYYDALYVAVIGFVVAIGGLVAAIAGAGETVGVATVVGIIVAAVGVIVGGISLYQVETVRAATISPVCGELWPVPAFAQ